MKRFGWIIFLVIGGLILLFGVYNALYIPALDPADPEEGWAWLTTDPEIIEYIKFIFRVQGIWIFGYGLLVLAGSLGLRQRNRWAWLGLWSVPLVILTLLPMMPWTMPIFFLPLVTAVGALFLLRPKGVER